MAAGLFILAFSVAPYGSRVAGLPWLGGLSWPGRWRPWFPDVGDLKEGIPGQLALKVKVPLLQVGQTAGAYWIECLDAAAQPKGGAN